MEMIMFIIHFMLFSILSWINAVECLEVMPERANMIYSNPKYMYLNATVNVRRYSRKSQYFINMMGTNKQTWENNITVTVRISQLLHNEYRRSFVEMTRRLCDLVNKEPFVGTAVRNAGMVCPLPPGYHAVMNISARADNFPNVFPFEKGRLEFAYLITDTKEPVMEFHIVASFKQKP